MRILLSLLLCLPALTFAEGNAPAGETQRIEYLIRSVEQLSNAKFIRNGTPYDANAAADHLRLKWREAGARVRTAQQFIELCGPKRPVSGQPDQIRFAHGKVVTSQAFLRAKLKELD